MIKSLYLIIKMFFKNKIQLLLEMIMLAKQLEIYQRTDPKLKTHRTDRMFFSLMMDWLSNWKERMFIVKPDTEIKLHRTAFKFYWVWKSQLHSNIFRYNYPLRLRCGGCNNRGILKWEGL